MVVVVGVDDDDDDVVVVDVVVTSINKMCKLETCRIHCALSVVAVD